MSDILQRAASWINDRRTAGMSQTVTYKRGGRSVSLAATKAPVRTQADQEFGILDIRECDWILTAADLVLNSVTVEPERNDEIVEANGLVWQVLPSDGDTCFRPSDPYAIGLRIHTKRIDA